MMKPRSNPCSVMEQIKGRAAENFFFRSLQLFAVNVHEYPKWIHDVRRASAEEDRRGIDFIVTTDAGEINVQIKSSLGWARNYIKNHRNVRFNICIIVLARNDTHISLFQRTRTVLAKRRQQMLLGTTPRFLLSAPPLPTAAP